MSMIGLYCFVFFSTINSLGDFNSFKFSIHNEENRRRQT